MKKHCLRILLPIAAFAWLSVSAKAQVGAQVAVTLPHDFVVSGRVFPAGRYVVKRISEPPSTGVVLSSYENHATVLVLPTTVESKIVSTPGFTMARFGDTYYLTKIETPGFVYTIFRPRPVSVELALKSRENTSPTGTSGNQ
jgi:hypothetical protein